MINNVVYNVLLICEVKIYLSSFNFGTDKLELSLSCNAKQGSELEPYKVNQCNSEIMYSKNRDTVKC